MVLNTLSSSLIQRNETQPSVSMKLQLFCAYIIEQHGWQHCSHLDQMIWLSREQYSNSIIQLYLKCKKSQVLLSRRSNSTLANVNGCTEIHFVNFLVESLSFHLWLNKINIRSTSLMMKYSTFDFSYEKNVHIESRIPNSISKCNQIKWNKMEFLSAENHGFNSSRHIANNNRRHERIKVSEKDINIISGAAYHLPYRLSQFHCTFNSILIKWSLIRS